MTTLYHGSPFDFDEPNPSYGKAHRDFGVGFYLAENENDSLSIAVKDSWEGYLYTYEMDDSVFDAFNVIEFEDTGDDWLSFVYDCRMGADNSEYDIIIGPTAGGAVNDIFEAARRNNTPFEEIKGQMAREITGTKFGWQWCIVNEDVLAHMTLLDKEHITR